MTFGLQPDATGKVDFTEVSLIDWQFAGIVKDHILIPRRKRVLAYLQKLHTGRKAKKEWLPIFLSTFVLLNTYTLLIRQQRSFAKEIGVNVGVECR